MPRVRSGYIRERKVTDKKGKEKIIYFARVTYTDLSGKRRSVERKADSRSQAKIMIREILNELDQRGAKSLEAAHMTFTQLAEWYAERYIVAPTYVDGRKVAGLRTYRDLGYMKNTLVSHLGAARIRDLTHADIEAFKKKRLETPIVIKNKKGKVTVNRQRSIRTVHLELALLRRMLSVAVREGWLIKNPFSGGDSLISEADEVKRDRVLTKDEETKLLAVCDGQRAHLRHILICALDTGMRRGEILKLVWRDVDFHNSLIHIRAFNTKTMKERRIPMTERLAAELRTLYADLAPSPADLVFGIADNIKRSFKTACRLAGVTGFRFHDCRRAYATRLIQGGMAIEQVARLLGHSVITTTYRYVNKAPETDAQTVEILNRLNQAKSDGHVWEN